MIPVSQYIVLLGYSVAATIYPRILNFDATQYMPVIAL